MTRAGARLGTQTAPVGEHAARLRHRRSVGKVGLSHELDGMWWLSAAVAVLVGWCLRRRPIALGSISPEHRARLETEDATRPLD